MRVARRHPGFSAVTLVAAIALAAISKAAGWSHLGLYGAMAVLIVIFSLLGTLVVIREHSASGVAENQPDTRLGPSS